MEEGWGEVHKASAHVGFVMVDIAAVQLHVAAIDSDSSALPIRNGQVTERSSNGVMDEGSGKIQEASAHVGSFIVMDVAIVESHVAANDAKTPALQNKEGKGHGKVIQRGDG